MKLEGTDCETQANSHYNTTGLFVLCSVLVTLGLVPVL